MTFHVFHIDEIYSDPSGTIQFVEFHGDAGGQNLWGGHQLNVTNGSSTNTFGFAQNLPGSSTSGKNVLVATQSYADLAAAVGNLPVPDYIVPDHFLFDSGNIRVTFPSMLGGDTGVALIAISRDGFHSSINFNTSNPLSFGPSGGAATPQNFADITGTIPLQPIAHVPLVNQATGVGQLFSDAVPANAFFNVDGDVITYAATLTNPDGSLPGWLSVDSLTGALSGTPTGTDVGTYHVVLTATDNDGTGTNSFDLTVIAGQVLNGGAGNDSISGTAEGDSITGLGGDDTLDGGAGDDTMVGGTGNDSYTVDSAGDVVTEASGQGTDTVFTSVTLPSLADNVENLTLATGTDNLNATGNSLNNVLTGNDGNNSIDGGVGADTMIGGDGDDTFVVDSTSDQVVESANHGTDLVMTGITLPALAANVENLTLTGSANVSATGNGLDNVITGNGGNNALSGGAGNDTLVGKAGDDTLTGGDGNDAFLLDQGVGQGADRIQDFESGVDQILLNGIVFGTLATGAVTADHLQVGAAADISATSGDADDYLKYASNTGELYFDVNGSAAGGLRLIAVLASPSCSAPHPTLDLVTAQDIVVI